MNITHYLQRIGYTSSLEPTLETLTALQKAHLFNIPFENLDIHQHIPITLSTNNFYKKIVEQHRGGFCFELNALFYELLQHLGFDVSYLGASVFHTKNGYGEMFAHLALKVMLHQKAYLVDVGFGEFAFSPLEIHNNTLQQDFRASFIIEQEEDVFTVFRVSPEMKMPEYRFLMTDCQLEDFSQMCQHLQTSADSFFTQKKFITLPTPTGRISLMGNMLKTTIQETVLEEEIISEEGYHHTLKTYFGVVL